MEVRLLGAVEVADDARSLVPLRAKERALLAALALHVGEVVAEAKLSEALWGEDPPATADKTLQMHMSRLRKALGDDGAAIETHPGGYRLAPERVDLDVARAAELLAHARSAKGPDAALTHLKEAAALWRGPSLGDLAGEAFAVGEAARLDELRTEIVEERIGFELALARHASVIGELEALCAAHPLRERLWSLRMVALYRAGRQAEALRAYQDLRAHLAEELGLEPSAELRDLDAAIARQDPALALADPQPGGTPATAALPTGVVTFLFTDIEGSTAMWEAEPDEMKVALARHDGILREAVESHGGSVVKTTGDGIFAVFARPESAVAAAVQAQLALAAAGWGATGELRARMGLHTGDAETRDRDYHGPAVNRGARLMTAGHGGQVLVSGATASLVGEHLPEGAELIGLGEHRLRDLGRPEVLYQLTHPDLPQRFPPLRTLNTVPGNLPLQLTSFIGRHDELASLTNALATSRLVTLTGTGGVGKTRLAVQAAASLVTAFPDGAWLCELAVATDPESMLQATVASLGFVPVAGADLGSGIAEFLGPRRALLLLDNCEHLLDPLAALAETLLARCPKIAILATSREALGLDGERVVRLRSLSFPHEVATLEQLADFDAARLFLDRAEATGAELNLGPADGVAISEICRRLDGIPLAIELAAARVIALTPGEIAAHLDERFRLLTGGRRAAVERHHTLRATIDWSYSLLDERDKEVFARLGIFPSSFDARAAQAVAADGGVEAWDVLDALTSLVAKSIINAERSTTGSTRYQMLETLRHYARERLDAADASDGTRRAHAHHFAAQAPEICAGVQGQEAGLWRERLEDDLDNFRAAAAWALESDVGGDAELAAVILGELIAGSIVMGRWNMFNDVVERAIERVEGLSPGYGGLLRVGAATNAYAAGDFRRGRELARKARETVRISPHPSIVLNPSLMFASRESLGAEVSAAVGILDELAAAPWSYALLHGCAAAMAAILGDTDLAQQEAVLAVELARPVGNLYVLPLALYAFGMAFWQIDPTAAETALEESRQFAWTEMQTARTSAFLAQLRANRGDYPAAIDALATGLHTAHINGDRPGMAACVARGAVVVAAAGDPEAAAVFVGVVTRGSLARLGALPPNELPEYDEFITTIRTQLGEERHAAAVARGAAMTYEQAAAVALATVEAGAG